MLDIDKEFNGLSCLISRYGVLDRSRGRYSDISDISTTAMLILKVFYQKFCFSILGSRMHVNLPVCEELEHGWWIGNQIYNIG